MLLNLLVFANISHAISKDERQNGDQTVQNPASLRLQQPAMPNQKSIPRPPIKPIDHAGDPNQNESVFAKLNAVINSIAMLEKKIQERIRLLDKAQTGKEKETIQNEIDELNQSIKDQENTFALIQTGGLSLSRVEDAQDRAFDWQKNLLEILQPIMNELHEYTEVRRI